MNTPDGIHLAGVGYSVAGRTILAGIDAELSERRIGILGQNGSGKTTLLRVIAGLVAPTAGTVRVDGLDPMQDRKAMLARLGVLFQNPDHQILFPTVLEEVAFGLRQIGHSTAEAETRAKRVLDAHGRAHWARAATSTLSQGQRHYLCLMAVLAMAPATILLDEPFAGLDLPTVQRLTRAFAALPQRLVTITHDPAALAGYDRVIWLEGGELRDDGPPGRVIETFSAEMARIGEQDADADLAD